MARIPTFDAGNLALHPSETGVEATAATARRVGMFAQQQAGAEEQLARETDRLGAETSELGSYKANLITGEGARLGSAVAAAGDAAVKVADHQQISHGAAAYARLMQKGTQDWNDTVKNADPNDPTVAQSFMARFEPALEDFKSSFWTEGAQQWAEAHADALRQHMATKTSADMATMAGQAAVVNQQKTINSLSATVHDDPSSVDFALAALKSSTEGIIASSPNLTGPEAGRARGEILQKGAESIVKSAAIGYISRTGQVPDWISDPKYSGYVNGQELQLFARQARTQQHYDQVMQKQTALLQRQLDEQAVHAAANKNFTDNVSVDQNTGRVVIKPQFFKGALDIPRRYPHAPNSANVAKTYLDWGEAQQREHATPVISDAATKADLMTRFADPEKPLSKLEVLRAEADGKIGSRDGLLMREMIDQRDNGPKDPVFHTAIDAAKERVGETILADGHERFANFMASFWPQYEKARVAGTLPPNALDLKDPSSMISKAIKAYEPTPAEKMQGHVFKSMGISNLGGITLPGPRVTTQDEFDKLPSGTNYIGSDGKPYRKP